MTKPNRAVVYLRFEADLDGHTTAEAMAVIAKHKLSFSPGFNIRNSTTEIVSVTEQTQRDREHRKVGLNDDDYYGTVVET